MKKLAILCALCVAVLTFSGCAILMGVSPITNMNFGGMHVMVGASSAYYIVTDIPQPIEMDLPFYTVNNIKYYQPIYDKSAKFSGISLFSKNLEMDFKTFRYQDLSNENSKLYPSGVGDSAKAEHIFRNFFVDNFSKITAKFESDSSKNIYSKCFIRTDQYGSLQDVCGAVRFSKRGSTVFIAMQSTTLGAEEVKTKIQESVNSIQFSSPNN